MSHFVDSEDVQSKLCSWINEILSTSFVKEDLAESLKNGVILCELMNVIEPRSIPRINTNTNVGYKIKENISFFKQAAEEFGVPKSSIFSYSDLMEGNIKPTLECLLEILNLYNKKVKGKINEQSRSLLPENFRNNLESLVQKNRKNNRIKKSVRSDSAACLNEIEQGKKKSEKESKKTIVLFQSLFRMYIVRKKYLRIRRHLAYRERVAQEILSTERNYVKSLQLCVDLYLNPLQGSSVFPGAPVLSKADIRSIFSDLTVILRFHETSILSQIEPLVKHWHTYQCLGDIFLKIMGFMKIYTQYVQNYSQSISTCERLRRTDPKFKHFLAEQQAIKELNKQNLAGFLIMPIQRIPRYHLLLSDLVKHTWEDHPDYNNLREAAEKLEQTSTLLNQKKKLAEGLKRLAEVAGILKNEIPFYLAEPHRRLIREGKFDNQILFLFNDMIVVTTVNYVPKGQKKRKTLMSKTTVVPVSTYDPKTKTTKLNDLVEELKLVHYCPLESVELVKLDSGKFCIRAEGIQAPIFSCVDRAESDVDKWVKKFNETKIALKVKNLARRRKSSENIHQRIVQDKNIARSDSVVKLQQSIDSVQIHLENLKTQAALAKGKKAKRELAALKDNLTFHMKDLNIKLNSKQEVTRTKKPTPNLLRQRSRSLDHLAATEKTFSEPVVPLRESKSPRSSVSFGSHRRSCKYNDVDLANSPQQ